VTGGRVPKYWTVKQSLVELIGAGRPGDALPTERDLADRLATSRTTVRQAIAELVTEGRLDRTQGSGTFVAEPLLVEVQQLTSFTDDLGPGRVANRVLSVSAVPADAEAAAALGVEPGTEVCCVERVRLVDGVPLAVEHAQLAGALPGLADELEARGSLYATLREVYDRGVDEVRDAVQSRLADPREAELLAVEPGHPLLVVRRHSHTADGRPVEWTRSVYRGDRFTFVAAARRT
jgi:GntR family transcriptional regulator